MKNNKCVYLHKDKLGVVRYVGHGNKDRPGVRSKLHRNKEWHETFKTESPIIEVVASNLTFDEAISLEQKLYTEHEDTLVNKRLPSRTKELDFNILNEWFEVDSDSPSGLIWKKKPVRSKLNVGDQAGSLLTKEYGNQYWQIKLNYSVYKVHRVVYLLTHLNLGTENVIDHIDGNGLNNSIDNLRLSDAILNCRNRKTSRNNRLQVKNVTSAGKGYSVTIKRAGKVYYKSFNKAQHGSSENALTEAIYWRDKKLEELA